MNRTERQERIKQLYADACALSGEGQKAFLAEVRATDDALARELESLLGQQREAEHFIEMPALNLAARVLAETQTEAFPKRIGAYEILEALGDLGRAYALMERREKAAVVLNELRERAKHSYVAPYNFETVYIGLGDKEQAFAWLEKAYEARSWYLTWLKVVPMFDSLRDDPRYTALLQRVGNSDK